MIAGDNLFDFEIGTFLDFFDRRDVPTIVAYDVGDRERATAYGVVVPSDAIRTRSSG
ncbi:nucleotidyltransferase [Natronococcus amylolyticus DSM 10524]|uniref:Nucleotidyltransferase n=1 Tax=Natronococcus amylolyticus DSM 10524 TaxID=1227497 RepID=L9X433_9EURY|nr:nucleotidyltransferase [Natronococcus amylolyticus DSM 10524]